MRRFLRHGPLHFIFVLSAVLVLVQGCTRTLLHTYPASEHEVESVSKAFARYQMVSQEVCGCCLDAEADAALSVSGWFRNHTGKLSGYLQAMEPSYIKFVAVNPLGQPLFILVTNGNMFQSLNVFEEKAYVGSVNSEMYKKFAPPFFEPEFLYYWLTGRLHPGDMRIQAVMRDRDQDAFWLQINHADSDTDSMVLFDPADLVILRHVIRDERGGQLVDILYADYRALPGNESQDTASDPAPAPGSGIEKELCRVPASITLSTNMDAEKIEVKLHSFLGEAHFTAANFYLEIPGSFKQLLAK